MIDFATIAICAVLAAALLAAAKVLGALFAWLGQPRVIGEIVGGLLLGPTGLGYFFPGLAVGLLPASDAIAPVMAALSQAGLLLLMYISGSHLRTFVEPGERTVIGSLAAAGIVLPFLAGLATVPLINVADFIGPAGHQIAFFLVFATAIAIASIPVISRIMLDLRILETAFGRIVIATAVIDDIVLYLVLAAALALVQANVGGEGGLAALLGIEPGGVAAPVYHVAATVATFLIVLMLTPVVLRSSLRATRRAFRAGHAALPQVLILAAASGVCIFVGVNPMFGALATGMAAGRVTSEAGLPPSKLITRWSYAVFVPLYFALVGYKLDLIHHCNWRFFVEFLAFACVVKAASIYFGARLAGQSPIAAINLAAALNARGGPGIVLASVTFEAGVINESFFSILVLLAVATSMIAGSWLGASVRRGDFRAPDESRGSRESRAVAPGPILAAGRP